MLSAIRQVLFSQAGFSPRQLFAALQGAWLEPRSGSIWQENTGVTPTTTGGQTIGLMLDQSQGAVTGPELVTDGGFANAGASWNPSAGVTAAVGSMSFPDTTGATQNIYQLATWADNQPYRLVVTGSGTVIYRTGTTDSLTTITLPANIIFARASFSSRRIQFFNVAGSAAVITSVSVRQVLGNHAYQATAANRPTLQFNGALPLARFDTNDFLSLSLPAINVRRNLLTYSEQFDNAAWVKFGGTLIRYATVAPNGLPAAKVTEGTTTGQHGIYQVVVSAAAAEYAASVLVKYAGRRYISLRVDNGQIPYAAIDLQTGLVVSGSGVVVTPQSDGWYFLTTAKPLTSAGKFITIDFLSAPNHNSFSYPGDGTSGIYVAYAQLELGSVATDYQKVTNWTSEAFASSGSVYFSTPVGMSALNNQSMATTYTLPALSSDIYSWMVFPQRLSGVQESRLALYMQQKAGIAGPDYLLDTADGQLTDDAGSEILLAQ